MTRFLVVGTSHVGALRLGWEAIAARYPQHEMRFFAAWAPTFRLMRFLGPDRFGLAPNTEGLMGHEVAALTQTFGAAEVDLRGAEVIVMAGLRCGDAGFLSLLQTCGIDGLTPPGGPDGRRLSRAAFDAISDSLADLALPAPGWRNRPGQRLVAIPEPRRGEAGADEAFDDDHRWQGVAARMNLTGVIGAHRARMARRMAEAGVLLVDQPAATLAESGLTRAEYRRGAQRLLMPGLGQPRHDRLHMNADFGALLLQALFDLNPAGAPRAGQPNHQSAA